MNGEAVVSAKNLGKSYWLYPTTSRRVLSCFFGPERVGGTQLKALSGLTFDLYPGQALALIGKNGAGKSTALQVLAGIIKPTVGEYISRGRVCALLELGSGFNPEFTGRQNIFIAGLLAGLNNDEIRASEQSIIEFADIGLYIDQPVKFYSSGMFLRLAFAVALAGKPDILIVDEALAVGDIFFRQKCYSRLYELRKKGMAVLLVTHSMADVMEFCDRALLLDKGVMVCLGDCKEVVNKYYHLEQSQELTSCKPCDEDTQDIAEQIKVDDSNVLNDIDANWVHRQGTCSFAVDDQIHTSNGYIQFIRITDKNNNASNVFSYGDRMRVYMQCVTMNKIMTPLGSYCIINSRGIVVNNKSSLHFECSPPANVKKGKIIWFISEVELPLEQGEYSISGAFAQIPRSWFDTRESGSAEILLKFVQRIASLPNFSVITIVAPVEHKPCIVTHHGLVNLPGSHRVIQFGDVDDIHK